MVKEEGEIPLEIDYPSWDTTVSTNENQQPQIDSPIEQPSDEQQSVDPSIDVVEKKSKREDTDKVLV